MKILYSHYLTDAEHPAVCMVEHIGRELRLLGHQVMVHASSGIASSYGGDRVAADGPQSTGIKRRLKQLLWFSKEMMGNRRRLQHDLTVLREFAPDVVLARQDAYYWSVVKAACQLRIPVVTYADAPVAYEIRTFNSEGRWHPPGLVERIERWGLAKSKAVIAVSHPGVKQIQRYGLELPVIPNPNGVDPTRFPERSPELRTSVLESFELDPKKTIIGFQGSFRAFHGVDRLLRLMNSLSRREDISWLLIGDGPERGEIEAAVSPDVDARFVGRQPASEMGKLLAAVDIAIAPHAQMKGDFYFCPLKIIEYAASGCAVVASQQGDIPLLLNDGACGEIIADDNLGVWQTAVEKLLDDPVYRAELGTAARQHALANFTWKHTAERVAAVLQDVVKADAKDHLIESSSPSEKNSSDNSPEAVG